MPPVSTIPVANNAAGVNGAGGKLPLVSTIPAANLPPLSTKPVAETIIKLLTN